MFFVFGPSGQMYRGGIEQLWQVAPVRRVGRTLALRTAAAGPESSIAPPDPALQPLASVVRRTGDTGTGAGPGTAATGPGEEPVPLRVQDAVTAYAQTGQGPRKPRQPLTRVSDVMRPGADITTVTPELQAHEAWLLLGAQRVAQAPVLDAHGQVVGLLLRADLAPPDLLPAPGAQVRHTIALARRRVEEVMVSPVPTVTADTALRSVASVLLESDLPGLPVTDAAGQLAGFVSRNDILRAVAGEPPLDLWSGAVQA